MKFTNSFYNTFSQKGIVNEKICNTTLSRNQLCYSWRSVATVSVATVSAATKDDRVSVS